MSETTANPDRQPIPVSVLTGFLGAGKTTLLNALLQDEAMANTAVIINEFGEVGLDHLLVETADENIMEMSSGCLCCTIRGDLIDTLVDLAQRRDEGAIKAFNRVVIETTGLADPAPVLHTIMSHEWLVRRFRLESVITVVDAVNAEDTLDAQEEAVKQVAVADRLVLTKTDLVSGLEGEQKLGRLVRRLRKLAPAARMLNAPTGEAQATSLFDAGLYNADTKTFDVKKWLSAEAFERPTCRPRIARRREMANRDHHHSHDHDHHHDVNRHDDSIRAYCITTDNAISAMSFDLFLELLRANHGPGLLRVKGIVKVEEDPDKPFIIHGVQHVFHPPVQLDTWPSDEQRTRLVFITRDVEKTQIEALLKAFTDRVTDTAAVFRDETLSLRSGGLLD
ncbi:MAG: CobW family GTP-binding protein [Hyphomicrobiales bacterium]